MSRTHRDVVLSEVGTFPLHDGAARAKADAKVQHDNEIRYTPWFTNEYVSVGP